MIAYAFGVTPRKPVARFCHTMCKSSFIEDRKAGLIYPAVHAEEGAYTHEQWSLKMGCCAYCGSQVVLNPRLKIIPKFPKLSNAS